MPIDILAAVNREGLKDNVPEFKSGDSLRIHVRVIEGEKERIQIFEGDVIQRKGAGVSETVTVRRVASGVGVERIFPIHSPRIAQIERIRRGRVRRARLNYLKSLRGKAARIAEADGR
ncbi:MAG: 50S ribosomal protein L19 [Candidatus Latescibacteria bacterium]|nr:50S ribosomal protein L19 [Candidatus Latescibacterota bacterium]